MKLLATMLVASIGLMAGNLANAQEALAKSSGCLNCHALDTKKMGPSFKEVAAKYKGNADAEKMLVAKLSEAKGHPAVKATPAELSGLVKWVLATP